LCSLWLPNLSQELPLVFAVVVTFPKRGTERHPPIISITSHLVARKLCGAGAKKVYMISCFSPPKIMICLLFTSLNILKILSHIYNLFAIWDNICIKKLVLLLDTSKEGAYMQKCPKCGIYMDEGCLNSGGSRILWSRDRNRMSSWPTPDDVVLHKHLRVKSSTTAYICKNAVW